MGRTTAAKQAKSLEQEQRMQSMLKHSTLQALAKRDAALAKVDCLHPDILLFEEQFIQPRQSYASKLKSRDLDKKKREQVKHFFAKYTVCKALENAWFKPASKTADLREWYICVAQGGSLYKQLAKPFLTKKEVHCLVTCPYDVQPTQAIIYAIAKAHGASEGICSMLFNSKLADQFESVLKPFWQSVIRFFVQNPAKNKAELNDLFDYLDYRWREGRRIRNAQGVEERIEFSMAGQHLSALRVKMEEWHRELQRAKVLGNHTWTGHSYQDSQYLEGPLGSKKLWTMTQICSSKELAQEGTAMRHCVLSYKARCVAGDTSIWTLRMQNCDDSGFPYDSPARKLTVEVSKLNGIVQARGLANRSARAEELNILRKWASDNGVYMGNRLY